MSFAYYDFFAGGGMSGVGLGPGWRCAFANEIDPTKAASYRANHGGGAELLVRDVAEVATGDLPGTPDLVWASFPCQDLSLAGRGAGLAGRRSGMFRPFWRLMEGLAAEGRTPKIIALENVCGAITSNGGRDFATLAASFADLGYRFGAVVVDAVRFVPQSRPRFFMIGLRNDLRPEGLTDDAPSPDWHPPSLAEARALLPSAAASRWVWWRLPAPPARNLDLAALVEDRPTGVRWHDAAETRRLMAMMTPRNRAKVEAACATGRRMVGTIYRRTRPDPDGARRQRAEVRFDGVAGCLRTPAGGSSRQTLMIVEPGPGGARIRTRLISAREAASLMGLPESYVLPDRYNDAYRLAGDGVAAPVVRHLAASLFEPALGRRGLSLVA